MILSQILRGIADVTAAAAEDRDGVLADIDGALFGAALRHAITLVVASMGEVVPGTIVSVLQAAATAAEQSAADRDELTEVVARERPCGGGRAGPHAQPARGVGRGRRGGRRRSGPVGAARRAHRHAYRARPAAARLPAGAEASPARGRDVVDSRVRGDVPAQRL